MADFAELEIALRRRDADGYAVELRYSQPKADADIQLTRGESVPVRFDLDELRARTNDAQAYGRLLGECLFSDPTLRTAFRQAIANAQTLNATLRLRLFINFSAPELHRLHWETLCDPEDGHSLVTSERVLFSRYLASPDMRPVSLRALADLRALVVIADPSNIGSDAPGYYPLPHIDVQGEFERARSGLASIPITPLTTRGTATLDNLTDHLRQGFDILYLVCHGKLVEEEPKLWLERENGQAEVVSGLEWVKRLQELEQLPRLIVLASCQSAGSGSDIRSGDEGALAALGPRLAEAGVPAVLAMQGNVSMQTVAQFMPAFFKALCEDGNIDRAASIARGLVRGRPDSWVPVLFMRLRSGRIWYVPGFGEERRDFEMWPTLIQSIRQGRCTPILGPGLLDPMLGSRRQMAQRWAEKYRFPMSPHDRENLPEVAQYLAVNQNDIEFPRRSLGDYLCEEILHRYKSELPDNPDSLSLAQLISQVGALLRNRDTADPYRVLASYPFPIYITTNPDMLLADALTAAGKSPQVEILRWNEDIGPLETIFEKEPDYEPTAARPLVYQLFGSMKDLYSLVLTEDDYFDYLIRVRSNKDEIPSVVRRALAESALLFLGFEIDDWDFRVLFRSIMSQEGGIRRRKKPHVAAQIALDETRILEPERARRYLESYFTDAHISIYWGDPRDFVRDLLKQEAGGQP